MDADTKAYISLGVAVCGLTLGIINFLKSWDKDRIKIKVTPQHAIPVGSADPSIVCSIEILNLSSFPITISQVGFLYFGTKDKGMITNIVTFDQGKFPRRLESRESFSVYVDAEPFFGSGKKVKSVYAATSCGIVQKGNSKALKQLSENNGGLS
jgi:hypothetical protein